MTHDYKVYKINHHDIPPDVESMFDLGFFEVEKTILQNKNHPYLSKRKRTANLLYCKKSTSKNIPRKE